MRLFRKSSNPSTPALKSGENSPKIYRIGRRRFVLAVPAQYRQYARLAGLLEKHMISVAPQPSDAPSEDGGDSANQMRAFGFIHNLERYNLVPYFLSLVLTQSGKVWKPMRIWRARRRFGAVGDTVFVEVVTDFFLRETALIAELARSFLPLLDRLMIMIRRSGANVPASDNQDQGSSTDRTSTTGASSNSELRAEEPRKSSESGK